MVAIEKKFYFDAKIPNFSGGSRFVFRYGYDPSCVVVEIDITYEVMNEYTYVYMSVHT